MDNWPTFTTVISQEYAPRLSQVRGYVIVLNFDEATSNCYDSTYYNIDAYTLKILLTI